MIFFLKNLLNLHCSAFVVTAVTGLLVIGTYNSTTWAGSESTVQHLPEMDVAWAQPDADRIAIFLCTKKQGKWGPPVKIHDLSADDLHPTVDRDHKDRIWLAWTAIDYQDFQIHYTVKDKGVWSDPTPIPVTTENNIAPYLLVINDVPWLVWSGNNDDDDDIYYSRFIDGTWQSARMIHPDNVYPDILPRLEVTSSGQPMVTWERFSDGEYISVARRWDGGKWISNAEAAPRKKASKEQSVTYAVPGRVWDGRQWTKMNDPAAVVPESDKKMKVSAEGNEKKILELPEFLHDIQSVYIRLYNHKRQ